MKGALIKSKVIKRWSGINYSGNRGNCEADYTIDVYGSNENGDCASSRRRKINLQVSTIWNQDGEGSDDYHLVNDVFWIVNWGDGTPSVEVYGHDAELVHEFTCA